MQLPPCHLIYFDLMIIFHFQLHHPAFQATLSANIGFSFQFVTCSYSRFLAHSPTVFIHAEGSQQATSCPLLPLFQARGTQNSHLPHNSNIPCFLLLFSLLLLPLLLFHVIKRRLTTKTERRAAADKVIILLYRMTGIVCCCSLLYASFIIYQKLSET